MDTVIQAYRFALDPTPKQQRALASHCGAARFAFNWGLALVKDRMDARQAGDEVDVPWTLPRLRREWNLAKSDVAPWWEENSKEAYSSGLDISPEHSRIIGTVLTGDERVRGSGFPASRNEVAHRTPAASPRAQFGWSRTDTTLRCLDSARSEPTNPRESSLVVLSNTLLASVPPPSRDERTVGLSRSPLNSNAKFPPQTARPPLSESTLEYDIWRWQLVQDLLRKLKRIRERLVGTSVPSLGRSEQWPDASQVARAMKRAAARSPEFTPASAIFVATPCTN